MSREMITYWEGRKPPAYIILCVTSWLRYYPVSAVRVLNQSNLIAPIGDLVSRSDLKMYSYAKQSDIVSAHYLYKFGGCFLDSDTIFISSKGKRFTEPDDSRDSFRYFGDESTGGVHIGALTTPPEGTVISEWSKQLLQRVPRWDEDRAWSYVGNQIVEPVIRNDREKRFSECFDVKKELATPEKYFYDLLPDPGDSDDSRHRYTQFWFQDVSAETAVKILDRLEEECGGLVLLHNSWTPPEYAALTANQIWTDTRLLSHALRRYADLERFSEMERLLKYGS